MFESDEEGESLLASALLYEIEEIDDIETAEKELRQKCLSSIGDPDAYRNGAESIYSNSSSSSSNKRAREEEEMAPPGPGKFRGVIETNTLY